MKRCVSMLAICLAMISVSAPLRAHEHFRVIGTVTKLEKTDIDVKNKAGKTLSISMDKQTKVSIDKKKVTTAELKVGQSVVVDAYGDDEFDLLAVDIRIVPAITSKNDAKGAPKSAPKK
jgi:hypothetical protein